MLASALWLPKGKENLVKEDRRQGRAMERIGETWSLCWEKNVSAHVVSVNTREVLRSLDTERDVKRDDDHRLSPTATVKVATKRALCLTTAASFTSEMKRESCANDTSIGVSSSFPSPISVA